MGGYSPKVLKETEPRFMYQSLIVGRLEKCIEYMDRFAEENYLDTVHSEIVARKFEACVDSLIDISIPSLRKIIDDKLREAIKQDRSIITLMDFRKLYTKAMTCVESGKSKCDLLLLKLGAVLSRMSPELTLEYYIKLLKSKSKPESRYKFIEFLRRLERLDVAAAFLLSRAKLRAIIDALEDLGVITKNDLVFSGSPDAHPS